MKKLTAEFIEKSIELIMKQAEDNINQLASQFRKNVLIPFCKKHGVTFAAGNGVFVFYKNGKGLYNDEFDNGFKIDPEIINILNITTTGNVSDFSHYIEDITSEDIK